MSKFGFHVLGDVLTSDDIRGLEAFVSGIRNWKHRVGDESGRRMSYGVEMDGANYDVVGRTQVPDVLARAGAKIMARAQSDEPVRMYCTSTNGAGDVGVDQVYVQKYGADQVSKRQTHIHHALTYLYLHVHVCVHFSGPGIPFRQPPGIYRADLWRFHWREDDAAARLDERCGACVQLLGW